MFSAQTASPTTVFTVSELTAQIRLLLEDVFDQVTVVGEISNAKTYPSGHWYFSLKDKEATLPCVCFKNANAALKFTLEDGLLVVARGKLNVYPPKGGYQLVVTSLEPVGIGEWQLAFEQLRKKLELEGLLAGERKRAIPLFPKRIGVVTSLAGAALQDILSAIRRRNPNVSVIIAPTKVQGDGSAEEIAQAIQDMQMLTVVGIDVDVILVARGGGSLEDLWSFNTETVARAIAASVIPVVSGVGHETDLTICDLIADLRAPTPTAAAELVASTYQELLDNWTNLNRLLIFTMQERLQIKRQALEKLKPARILTSYQEKITKLKLALQGNTLKATQAMSNLLLVKQHNFRQNHEQLKALSPINVLGRGFSILRKLDGTIVRQISKISVGDTLEALLEHGKLIVKVESLRDSW